jgi:hypothetical protein
LEGKPEDIEGDVKGVWALKTRFNDRWDFVNVKTLQTLIYDEWKKSFGPQTLGKRKASGLTIVNPSQRLRDDAGSYSAVAMEPSPGLLRGLQASLLDDLHSASSGNVINEEAELVIEPADRSIPWPEVFVGKRLLVSRKRFTNLWDLTRTWNKSILSSLEEKSLTPESSRSSLPRGDANTTYSPSESPEMNMSLPMEEDTPILPDEMYWQAEIDESLRQMDRMTSARRAQDRLHQAEQADMRLRKRKLPTREYNLVVSEDNTVPISQLASLGGSSSNPPNPNWNPNPN